MSNINSACRVEEHYEKVSHERTVKNIETAICIQYGWVCPVPDQDSKLSKKYQEKDFGVVICLLPCILEFLTSFSSRISLIKIQDVLNRIMSIIYRSFFSEYSV